jgi:hypothetical protein
VASGGLQPAEKLSMGLFAAVARQCVYIPIQGTGKKTMRHEANVVQRAEGRASRRRQSASVTSTNGT